MATTILATAGQAVAGPWGAALGALAGRAIDRAGGARRADDLPVTSSAYGQPIPAVFGRVRVAGNLVWSTAVRPAETGKGGAGRGAIASFALVLAQAPVATIGRIWADGALLRDADGTWARRTDMRAHLSGTGGPDPLIAAAHPGRAPAFAGLAYVVFENVDLAPFGERLPNLVFELIGADSDAARWSERLFGVPAEPGMAVGATGMVGSGARRDDAALAALLAGLRPAATAAGIALAGEREPILIPAGELLVGDGPELLRDLQSPSGVEVSYLDSGRDFQRGTQRFGSGGRTTATEIPAALEANAATRLAASLAADAVGRARQLRLRLSWRWIGIRPGDVLRLQGIDGDWRVTGCDLVGMLVEVECEAAVTPRDTLASADTGGMSPAVLRRVPSTLPALIELPGDGVRAVASGGAGWEGAALMARVSPGDLVLDLGFETAPTQVGTLAAPLAASSASLWDEAGVAIVEVHGADAIQSRSAAAVLAGANRAVIGGEMISFRTAEPVADGRVALSGLLRGRGWTDALVRAHPPGTPVVFLHEGTIGRPIVGTIGSTIILNATGPGDPAGGHETTITAQGLATSALAPSHLQAERIGGLIAVSWTARRRDATSWDVVPAPTRWRVLLTAPDGTNAIFLSDAAGWQHTSADLPEPLRSAPLTIEVTTLGDGPEDFRTARAQLKGSQA